MKTNTSLRRFGNVLRNSASYANAFLAGISVVAGRRRGFAGHVLAGKLVSKIYTHI